MGRSALLARSAHRDHKESKVSKVKLVFLVPLVLLGWTVLSVLLGVTVGKAIKDHLDPSDPSDRPEPQDLWAQWEKAVQTESQVYLGPLDHQVLSGNPDLPDQYLWD